MGTTTPDEVAHRATELEELGMTRSEAITYAGHTLSSINGYTNEDIAEWIGVEDDTVKTYLSRARSKINKSLELVISSLGTNQSILAQGILEEWSDWNGEKRIGFICASLEQEFGDKHGEKTRDQRGKRDNRWFVAYTVTILTGPESALSIQKSSKQHPTKEALADELIRRGARPGESQKDWFLNQGGKWYQLLVDAGIDEDNLPATPAEIEAEIEAKREEKSADGDEFQPFSKADEYI